MIERVLLVAWRELGATLLSRAFVVMLLAPLLTLLAVPFVFTFVTILQGDSASNEAAPEPLLVEIYAPTERLDVLLESADSTLWDLRPGEGPVSEAPDLLSSEAAARVVLGEQGSGRYTVYARPMKRPEGRHTLERLRWTLDEALARQRAREAGLDAGAIEQAWQVESELQIIRPPPRDLAAMLRSVSGLLLPSGVLFVMFAALSMAGQGLLTSTLEEKTTRVAEVLLGAVSPTELLTGKMLGQLAVSLILSLGWGGPSLIGLFLYANYALGPLQVLYLLVLIAFASLSWAAVMGGIGGAMNDLTEAQHILGPLFMVMMVFFLPAIAAIATPDSSVVVVCSMIPPTAAPTMAARIASSTPPPHWQVAVGLLSSGALTLALVWAAGRLFRIGLLLRSDPPNVRTLVRWVVTGG